MFLYKLKTYPSILGSVLRDANSDLSFKRKNLLITRIIASILCFIALSACSHFDGFYKEPKMSASLENHNHKISTPNIEKYKSSPQTQKAFYQRPAALDSYQKNGDQQASLWQSGPSSLFGDRRAKQIGDIVTVNIEIDDQAQFDNRTERQRQSNNNSTISAALGIDEAVDKFLPSPLSLSPGVTTSGNTRSIGEGIIERRETINLKIAAIVTDILPNGNMVIQGTQEVRVNYELRDLQVTGLIRPEDISRRNTVSYEKIAEARISYGGRGQVSNLQQPRYGDQLIDIVSPF